MLILYGILQMAKAEVPIPRNRVLQRESLSGGIVSVTDWINMGDFSSMTFSIDPWSSLLGFSVFINKNKNIIKIF